VYVIGEASFKSVSPFMPHKEDAYGKPTSPMSTTHVSYIDILETRVIYGSFWQTHRKCGLLTHISNKL
jgi:hypothetical protein